eukprot:2489293-Pyramimonas_sp.AAC.1
MPRDFLRAFPALTPKLKPFPLWHLDGMRRFAPGGAVPGAPVHCATALQCTALHCTALHSTM